MKKKTSIRPDVPPKNIIVRMPNWFGDAVMAAPIIADLRTHFPDAEITVMCQGNIGQLFKYDPNINDIFNFKRPSGWVHREGHLEIIDVLKRGKFDLGILLTNSFSSAWWFWMANVKNRIGFKGNFRSLLLSEALPIPKDLEKTHLVKIYKRLLEPLGIASSSTQPKLYVSEKEKEEARQILMNDGIQVGRQQIIGINPGASYGSAKCWLPDRFREVARQLVRDEKYAVVFFGDRAGAPLVDEICRELSSSHVINLSGKTSIRELMALISCCTAFLTNDSGPMHMASALDIPLTALFGSTSAVKTGPLAVTSRVVHKHVECSPCYKRTCPIDFRCMTRIGSDEVLEEIYSLLREQEQ